MDERLLDDYAFEGLDSFVRFDEGRNSPYFRVVFYLDSEEHPIKILYPYGTWVVADGDVSFVVSELSKDVFEYEVMHVHWLMKYRFEDWGVSEDGAWEKNGDSGSCVSV